MKLLGEKVLEIRGGDIRSRRMVMLWVSGIGCGFIDNIGLVGSVIGMMKDMGGMGMRNVEGLWWGL